MRSSDRVVVIGASAGGIEALVQIVRELPAQFAAPLLVGVHTPSKHHSYLPSILSRAGALPASHPLHGEPLQAGHIYIAPPGQDLMLVGYCAAVQPTDQRARFRPSLDALFQSAAHHHGARTIGVVLSGALDDGTVGLRSISDAGGTTIVQSDAAFDTMPQNALAATKVDYAVPAAKLGALLGRLTDRLTNGAVNEPREHLHEVVQEMHKAMRASSGCCTISGEASKLLDVLDDGSINAALSCAEERIALLQLLAGKADAAAADRTAAAQYLRALEDTSDRVRRMISMRL